MAAHQQLIGAGFLRNRESATVQIPDDDPGRDLAALPHESEKRGGAQEPQLDVVVEGDLAAGALSFDRLDVRQARDRYGRDARELGGELKGAAERFDVRSQGREQHVIALLELGHSRLVGVKSLGNVGLGLRHSHTELAQRHFLARHLAGARLDFGATAPRQLCDDLIDVDRLVHGGSLNSMGWRAAWQSASDALRNACRPAQ